MKIGEFKDIPPDPDLHCKRLALVFGCEETFMPAAQVMLASFKKHNPWFGNENHDVILVYAPFNVPSTENITILRSIFPRIIFWPVQNVQKYIYLCGNYCTRTWGNPRGIAGFLRMDVYSFLDRYDRIAYLDSDSIVLGDMSPLFWTTNPPLVGLGRMRAGWFPNMHKWTAKRSRKFFEEGLGIWSSPERDFSSGVSAYSEEINEHFTYEEMLGFAMTFPYVNTNMEEDAHVAFLKRYEIPTLYIPYKFCPPTRLLKGRDFNWYRANDLRLIPYTGMLKPWTSKRTSWNLDERWRWDYWWLIRRELLGLPIHRTVQHQDLNRLYKIKGNPEGAVA